MLTVNMHEAKSQLSRLVEKALAGEEVFIARAGKPQVRLVPVVESRDGRPLGKLKGQFRISADFDDTPQELIDSFYYGKTFTL